jgi:hypothetical protein
MSDYALSVLVNGQAIVKKRNNIAEQRRPMPTIMELALRNQEFSDPNAQDLRTSPLRPVDVMYFKDVAAGSATGKTYNHTGTYGDSGKVNVTYVTCVETLGLPIKMGANNFLRHSQIFANLLEMKIKNLRTRQDAAALAALIAGKNQLLASTMDGRLASSGLTWDDTTKSIGIEATDKSLFIAKMKSAMSALQLNYMADEYDVICDLQTGVTIENYMNQGAGNQNNTSWQFAGCNFTRTQRVIDSAYPGGATLWMPKGSMYGLNWNEQANKIGLDSDMRGASIGDIGTMADPMGSGAIFDVSFYSQRADTSADTTGGSPQDFVLQMEITSTIGYVYPPLSLANDSVIIEGGQKVATP